MRWQPADVGHCRAALRLLQFVGELPVRIPGRFIVTVSVGTAGRTVEDSERYSRPASHQPHGRGSGHDYLAAENRPEHE